MNSLNAHDIIPYVIEKFAYEKTFGSQTTG